MRTEGPTQLTHTREAAAYHLPGKSLFLIELTHSLSHLYTCRKSLWKLPFFTPHFAFLGAYKIKGSEPEWPNPQMLS